MAKYLGPKAKRCRRLNVKLDSRAGNASSVNRVVSKRKYPPGMHGPKGYPRITDFAEHLNEKQKVKLYYNVLEKQLRNYFEEASHGKGDSNKKFIELLERRLDNVVYRLGLATTRMQARQFASHKLFQVNGRTTNIPSYRLSVGDKITIRKAKSLEKGYLAENLKSIEKLERPEWLKWDAQKNEGQVVALPSDDNLEIGIDVRLIIEYYSK